MDKSPPATSWFRFTKAAAIAVLLLSCAAAYWLGSQSYDPMRLNHGLTIDEADLDCGVVLESKDVRWQATLRNPTRHPIRIEGFSNSCECGTITPKELTLNPGEQHKLSMVLDLTRRSRDEAHRHERPFAVRIIPIVKGAPAQLGWVFRGSVRSVYAAEPPGVDFGDHYILGEPVPSRVVRLTAHQPIRIQRILCEPAIADVRLRTDAADSSKAFELEIALRDDLRAGNFSGEVVVEATTPADEPLPPFSIPIKGQVRQGVEAVPAALVFGVHKVCIGTAPVESLSLRSITNAPFQVLSIKADSSDVGYEAAAMNDRLAKTYAIRQCITTTGWQTTTLRLHVRQRGREFDVEVPVGYLGKDP